MSSSESLSLCAKGFGPRCVDPQCGHESISLAYAARHAPQKQSDPVWRWMTCDVAALTSLKTSSCVPMRMRSPSLSSISPFTGTPLTRHPLRLPRSSRMAFCSSTKMRAWRREIAGSKMVMWQSSPRPMSVWPAGRSNSCNKNRRRYRAGVPWLGLLIPVWLASPPKHNTRRCTRTVVSLKSERARSTLILMRLRPQFKRRRRKEVHIDLQAWDFRAGVGDASVYAPSAPRGPCNDRRTVLRRPSVGNPCTHRGWQETRNSIPTT